jgi:hypothetical protein
MILFFKEIIILLLEKMLGISLLFLQSFRKEEENLVKGDSLSILI